MGTTEDYIETVLTCEGDLYDPEFETQLLQLKQRLQDLISPNAKKLQIKKVEPWNSVKITFDIPREAAVRLKQLAEQGDHTLKQLGILSVQIEGDQSISLTIAGKNNETTELVFRTGLSSSLQSHNVPASHTGAAASSEPFEMGSSDHPLPDPSDVEATRKNIARYLGGHSNAVPMLADMFDPHSSEGKFKVPSSVGMQGNDGLPHSSPANRSPAHPSLPSPGAMSAIRPPPSYSSAAAAAAFQQHQGLYVGSGHQQGQMSPVSPKYPTPPPSVSNPNSPGLRVGNTPLSLPMQGGVHGPQVNPIMNNMARLMGQKDITSSSPLLVNLLQNDANALGHFNNLAQHGKLQFPFDSGPPPKKKRKPRKQKDKGSISVDQSVSGNMDIIGMSTIPLQDRVPVSGEPAIGLGQFMRSQNATPPSQNTGYFGHNIMNRSPDDKHRHIINPITGQLELVDDDSSSSSLARPESTASAVSLDTGPPLSQLHPPPNPLVALQQSKLFPTLSSSALTLSSPQLSVSSDSSSHAKQLVRSQESFTSLQREQLQHHGLTQQLPMFSGGNVQGSKVTSVQANVSLPQPHVLEHSSSSTIASPVITTITSVACGAVGISSMSGHRHHPTLSTNEHNLPAHSEQNPVSQQSLVSTRINRQPVATVESSGTVYHDPSIHEKASVHGQVPHSIRQSHPSVTTSSLSLLGQMVHSQFPAPISAHSTTMMKQAALALTTLAQAAHEKLNQQQPPSIQQCTVPSPNQPSLVDNQVLPTQETPPNSADTQSNISSDNHSLSSQSSPGPHPQSSACNADSSFEPQNNVPKEGEPNDKNDPGSESDYKEQLSGLSVDTPNAEQKDTMVESETVADIAHEAGIQIVEDPHNTETVCASEVTHGEGAQSEPVVASPLSTLSSENRSPVHSVSPHLDHKDNIIEHHEDMDIKDSLVKNGNEISKESPTYGSGSTNGPTSMDSADSGVSMSEKKDAPSNGGIDSYDVYTSDQAGPVSNIDSQEKEFEQDGKLGITGKISKPVSPQLVHNSVVNHDSVLSNHTDEPFESDTEIHKNQDTCSPTESANKLQDIHQETTSNSLSKNVITVGYAMSNENPTNTILQSDVTSKLFTSATKKHVIDDSVPFLMRPFSKLSPSEVKEHTGSFSSIDQSLNWMGRSDLNPGGKRGDGVGLHSLQFSKVPISPINGEDQNNSEFKLWLGGKLQTQNNNKPDIKETQTLFSEKSSISSDKGLEEPKSEEKRDLSHLESSFDSQAKKDDDAHDEKHCPLEEPLTDSTCKEEKPSSSQQATSTVKACPPVLEKSSHLEGSDDVEDTNLTIHKSGLISSTPCYQNDQSTNQNKASNETASAHVPLEMKQNESELLSETQSESQQISKSKDMGDDSKLVDNTNSTNINDLDVNKHKEHPNVNAFEDNTVLADSEIRTPVESHVLDSVDKSGVDIDNMHEQSNIDGDTSNNQDESKLEEKNCHQPYLDDPLCTDTVMNPSIEKEEKGAEDSITSLDKIDESATTCVNTEKPDEVNQNETGELKPLDMSTHSPSEEKEVPLSPSVTNTVSIEQKPVVPIDSNIVSCSTLPSSPVLTIGDSSSLEADQGNSCLKSSSESPSQQGSPFSAAAGSSSGSLRDLTTAACLSPCSPAAPVEPYEMPNTVHTAVVKAVNQPTKKDCVRNTMSPTIGDVGAMPTCVPNTSIPAQSQAVETINAQPIIVQTTSHLCVVSTESSQLKVVTTSTSVISTVSSNVSGTTAEVHVETGSTMKNNSTTEETSLSTSLKVSSVVEPMTSMTKESDLTVISKPKQQKTSHNLTNNSTSVANIPVTTSSSTLLSIAVTTSNMSTTSTVSLAGQNILNSQKSASDSLLNTSYKNITEQVPCKSATHENVPSEPKVDKPKTSGTKGISILKPLYDKDEFFDDEYEPVTDVKPIDVGLKVDDSIPVHAEHVGVVNSKPQTDSIGMQKPSGLRKTQFTVAQLLDSRDAAKAKQFPESSTEQTLSHSPKPVTLIPVNIDGVKLPTSNTTQYYGIPASLAAKVLPCGVLSSVSHTPAMVATPSGIMAPTPISSAPRIIVTTRPQHSPTKVQQKVLITSSCQITNTVASTVSTLAKASSSKKSTTNPIDCAKANATAEQLAKNIIKVAQERERAAEKASTFTKPANVKKSTANAASSHGSSPHISSFVQKSLNTPSKVNTVQQSQPHHHPIMAPGFHLNLTESVQKVMKAIPQSDSTPPQSPKSCKNVSSPSKTKTYTSTVSQRGTSPVRLPENLGELKSVLDGRTVSSSNKTNAISPVSFLGRQQTPSPQPAISAINVALNLASNSHCKSPGPPTPASSSPQCISPQRRTPSPRQVQYSPRNVSVVSPSKPSNPSCVTPPPHYEPTLMRVSPNKIASVGGTLSVTISSSVNASDSNTVITLCSPAGTTIGEHSYSAKPPSGLKNVPQATAIVQNTVSKDGLHQNQSPSVSPNTSSRILDLSSAIEVKKPDFGNRIHNLSTTLLANAIAAQPKIVVTTESLEKFGKQPASTVTQIKVATFKDLSKDETSTLVTQPSTEISENLNKDKTITNIEVAPEVLNVIELPKAEDCQHESNCLASLDTPIYVDTALSNPDCSRKRKISDTTSPAKSVSDNDSEEHLSKMSRLSISPVEELLKPADRIRRRSSRESTDSKTSSLNIDISPTKLSLPQGTSRSRKTSECSDTSSIAEEKSARLAKLVGGERSESPAPRVSARISARANARKKTNDDTSPVKDDSKPKSKGPIKRKLTPDDIQKEEINSVNVMGCEEIEEKNPKSPPKLIIESKHGKKTTKVEDVKSTNNKIIKPVVTTNIKPILPGKDELDVTIGSSTSVTTADTTAQATRRSTRTRAIKDHGDMITMPPIKRRR